MAKNYFSDSNVIAMTIDAGAIVDTAGSLETNYIITHTQLKFLLNLAVETAIGEPVGIFKGEFDGDVNGNLWFKSKATTAIPALGAELYAVKELDN